MRIIESRSKREGPYAGRSQGRQCRYSPGFGWKKLPLQRGKLKVNISAGLGFMSSTVLYVHKGESHENEVDR